MGLSKEALKYIEKDAQKKASELAHEAQKKLISHYEAMIDWYYRDYDPVAYVRTHNLYNSYRPFYKNSHSTIYYGGVEVTADRMHENYGTDKHPFAAADLLSTYIYTLQKAHGMVEICMGDMECLQVFLFMDRCMIIITN